ncbi:PP-loop family protein [Colletotrichum graminicola]|uniref:tRNA(Ile)-lysidine synthetase n=1 Tax=Colletotrichum graminicola (strain M1.001 / M2 / FGSC 10212) TaxID=645133 RepID=E3QQ61_COLGM|nr:PP-loop family protein [Colletotrichum graminicola M1.001]EFQ32999.1 PP-loop family protein [Colletotrichum graminicola M1.001]WDK09244.1 PP-loop family protein [Colletotrichum graminicola]
MGLTNPSPLATAAASAAAASATAAAAAATRQYLHPTPKPVSLIEFTDALRAAAPPRFPHARTSQPRRIGLAVSGGVDSMALAYLFNRLREVNPLVRVVDNPLTKISALVVDHGLRPGSDAEAQGVARELRTLRYLRAHIDRVNWRAEGVEGDPAALPNLESAARRARYRRLGIFCAALHIESLFLAHHQDDQHETVLMRLLAGHGSRGLRGISPAANIPECYDMHGVYESGHVDDQMMPIPHVSFRPHKKDWKSMRMELRSELDMDLYAAELRAGLQVDWHESPYVGGGTATDALSRAASSASARARAAAAAAAARNMPRISVEDAGVMIYRPLLGFGKDRLVATCEANNVRWFEDSTNKDRTLTMRNAVRHMVREHALPAALRKDNVLRLAARCDARVRGQEHEADRWLRRYSDAEFEPNVGTLAVRLPDMGVPGGGGRAAARGTRTRTRTRKSVYDDARRELRLAHRRLIAALIVRRLVAFVSPDRNPPQLSSLQTVVGRLFPALADPSDPATPPKAFNQASVLFLPVAPGRWYLVREPYPSLHPPPEMDFYTAKNLDDQRYPIFPPIKRDRPPAEAADAEDAGGDGDKPAEARVVADKERIAQLHRQPLPSHEFKSRRWYSWRRFRLWDGRFWVRVRGRVKAVFRVAPFAPIHAKAFREALGPGQSPPAAGGADADADADTPSNIRPEESAYGGSSSVTGDDGDDARARLEGMLKRFAPGKVRYTLPALYAVNRDEETGEEMLRMLALPTLGVCLPGLERWVQYEFRYRKVDMGLLDGIARGGDSGSSSRTGERTPRAAAVLRKRALEEGKAEERVRRRLNGVRRERLRGARAKTRVAV